MKTLNIRKNDETYKVNDILGNELIKNRLTSLGIIKDSKISIYKKAPFGDPVLVKVNNSVIALRKNIFDNIIITKDLGE